MSSQAFHRTPGGRIRKITAGEQFKPRIIESFDPTTQELNQDLPVTIHTKTYSLGSKFNSHEIRQRTAHSKASGAGSHPEVTTAAHRRKIDPRDWSRGREEEHAMSLGLGTGILCHEPKPLIYSCSREEHWSEFPETRVLNSNMQQGSKGVSTNRELRPTCRSRTDQCARCSGVQN
jgi:hypothetical protein